MLFLLRPKTLPRDKLRRLPEGRKFPGAHKHPRHAFASRHIKKRIEQRDCISPKIKITNSYFAIVWEVIKANDVNHKVIVRLDMFYSLLKYRKQNSVRRESTLCFWFRCCSRTINAIFCGVLKAQSHFWQYALKRAGSEWVKMYDGIWRMFSANTVTWHRPGSSPYPVLHRHLEAVGDIFCLNRKSSAWISVCRISLARAGFCIIPIFH